VKIVRRRWGEGFVSGLNIIEISVYYRYTVFYTTIKKEANQCDLPLFIVIIEEMS
jgi:hypothetical protein